ncbi:hypothetical protein [Nitrososphaera viennensis]|uniref:Uncharacterized protein n=1 Tax=Nitrososphaera viennensis EN76 TaxID=926571 RepID=A0A060HI29_9ARCH|nr:hypothetical protein [Nitrososphaera viennensis]AIC14930.1 hypothetical protein NVIE_007220 [Nitrososphaera viennensis EN76]
MCCNAIHSASLSFEQRLIDDKDFCRKCWDEITGAAYPEEEKEEHISLLLVLVATAKTVG